MKKFIALMTIVFAVVLISGCGAEKDLKDPKDTLLYEMIGAYGGAENLSKLASYVSVWDIEVRVRPRKGKAINSVELPDKLRVELIYPKSSETRVINATKGFKSYNREPLKEVAGPRLDSMKLQLMRLYTPLVLQMKLNSITLSEAGGYRLLTLKEGSLTAIYHVNSATFTIDKVIGRLNMGGREMEFLTEYSDFKKVNGVLMHHRENKFAAGMNTAELFLKELKLNEKHADGVFK